MDERLVDWGASGRVDRYYARLVDPLTLSEVGEVQLRDSGSSITYSYSSDNHVEATIDLAEGDYLQGQQQRMIRVYDEVRIGGFDQSYCLGTFFVANLTNNSKFGREQRKLSCYGPMYRFTQDYMAEDFSRPLGSNCVDNIRYIVEQHGGTLVVNGDVDTSQVHTKDINFPVGSNLADTLNTYAGWINAEIVTVNDGTLMLRHYYSPQDLSPVYTFEEGANCVYTPGLEFETNRDEPINRVIAFYSREKNQPDPNKANYDPYPLMDSCHVELGPAEPFSFENCGRYRTQVMEVQQPATHEDLVAFAQRVLETSAASILNVSIEHVGIPWLRVGDLVKYVNNRDPGRANVCYAIVDEMAINSLSPLCMTKTKLRCYY